MIGTRLRFFFKKNHHFPYTNIHKCGKIVTASFLRNKRHWHLLFKILFFQYQHCLSFPMSAVCPHHHPTSYLKIKFISGPKPNTRNFKMLLKIGFKMKSIYKLSKQCPKINAFVDHAQKKFTQPSRGS